VRNFSGSYYRISGVSRRAAAGRRNSDLGSGFEQGSGDVVSSSTDSSDQRPSIEFTAGVRRTLAEVDFVTSIDRSGDPNDITVTLSSDGGGHPGTAIVAAIGLKRGVRFPVNRSR
jgi:hypothetical protein